MNESRRFWTGVGYGLIGTITMSVVMWLVYAFDANTLPEPIPLGLLVRLVARVLEGPELSLAIAIALHLAYGAFWIGLLSLSAKRLTWWKGLVVGLGLWLLMMIFWLPLAGRFTFAAASEPRMWFATFVMHAIYGATSGGLAQLRERGPHRRQPLPAPS